MILTKTALSACLVSIGLMIGSSITFAESMPKSEFVEKVKVEEEQNSKYLLAETLNKAKALQEAYGDFAPFAAGLFPNGEVKFVWLAKPGQIVKDPLQAVLILRSTLQQQAGSSAILASTVAYKIKPKTSEKPQLNIELEYLSGMAKLVSVDFNIAENKKVKWNNVMEAENESFVFKPYATTANISN